MDWRYADDTAIMTEDMKHSTTCKQREERQQTIENQIYDNEP